MRPVFASSSFVYRAGVRRRFSGQTSSRGRPLFRETFLYIPWALPFTEITWSDLEGIWPLWERKVRTVPERCSSGIAGAGASPVSMSGLIIRLSSLGRGEMFALEKRDEPGSSESLFNMRHVSDVILGGLNTLLILAWYPGCAAHRRESFSLRCEQAQRTTVSSSADP